MRLLLTFLTLIEFVELSDIPLKEIIGKLEANKDLTKLYTTYTVQLGEDDITFMNLIDAFIFIIKVVTTEKPLRWPMFAMERPPRATMVLRPFFEKYFLP